MIYAVVKFRMGTKDWPYVIDYRQTADGGEGGNELITERTVNRPRPSLIENAHDVATLALLYHGLRALVEASQGANRSLWYDLASVAWSDGDDPGAKVEVHVHGKVAVKDTGSTCDLKLTLEKIPRTEETELIAIDGMKTYRPVMGSVRNQFNEKVLLLRDQVKGFAEGEFSTQGQGDLFRAASGNP